MKTLSKEAENKLLGAIEKTAVFVNEGLDPSTAIAKAASEDGIPAGHINLMVHAYNTGRTSRQRTAGSDTLEKAADFPLADAEVVLEQLYPAQVKTAAAMMQSTVVSTEYALSPTGLLGRRAAAVKVAVAVPKMVAAGPEPYSRDPAEAMKRAFANVDRQKKAAEESRRQVAAAFDKMARTFMDITDYFRSPSASPINVVSEQAYLLHGGKGRQLIDEIVKVTPGLLKMSHHKQAVIRNSLQSVDGEVYGLISQFMDELDTHRSLKEAHVEIEKTAARESEAALRPFVSAPRSVLDEDSDSSTEKRGDMGLLYGASAIKNLLGSVNDSVKSPFDDGTDKVYNKITDPDHEAQLRNIQSQAMMQDMLLNDPVISGYDPQETLNAYNDIVAVAPHTATQRLIMQSLLRKRLEQGSMDPFEADQLLGIERKQQQIATPGKVPANDSVLA